MVRAAKIAYKEYPTVVNEIAESGLPYDNVMSDYARMDSKMQSAQKAIGGSSDSAQLAQSYMWTKVFNNEFDEEYIQLYHNTVILAVLAQVAIDGCKKVFEIDVNEDIKRIRNMACMKRKNDYPKFMKWTQEISATKNGKERDKEEVDRERERLKKRIDENIVCPMNWLQNCLDKIQGANRQNPVETIKYLNKPVVRANNIQMTAIRKIVEEYDSYTKYCMLLENDDESFICYVGKTEDVIGRLKKMSISQQTMYRLIETSLGYEGRTHSNKAYKEATKYMRKMMNLMYRYDKNKFLKCFKNS